MIEINNISKKFIIKNIVVQALQDINLIIEEKDCFAIVGESGSGKTTLANIMLGIYQQDEGNILFEKSNFIENVVCINESSFNMYNKILCRH